ncbi:hypothetical protein N2152v2_000320 [Parachlorella kessleri]
MAGVTDSPEVRRFNQGYIAPHPSIRKDAVDVDSFLQNHQVYTKDYLVSVTPSHHNPNKIYEALGWYWHVAVRTVVWLLTGIFAVGADGPTESQLASRIQFFASAGQAVGAAGALANHLKSAVFARSDNGWVHTLLAEAECLRAHMGTIVMVETPSFVTRIIFLGVQAQVFVQYFLVYLLAPGVAHAYSAYRAEEQLFNYSQAIRLIERGNFRKWRNTHAPDLARAYYALPAGSTFQDVLLRLRADEACIHHMNMVFAQLWPGSRNPFITMGSVGKQ